MKQFNKFIEFRQAVYDHGLTRARDAQFELVDALLLSPPIRSFPELSLSPVFQRQWPSAYAAVEDGEQDRTWLESHFMQQIPTRGPQAFSLDGTAWPHPAAKTMSDRQYVYSPTKTINSHSVVIGHPYSVLAWVPEQGRSWAAPVSVRRVPSEQTEIEMGITQVKELVRQRRTEMEEAFHLVVADCKYGNHRFLGPLKEEPCGKLVRLRRDRVLYGPPGPYGGRGRPRTHGDRFACKEPETWGEPAATVELEDAQWGQVRFQCHLGRDAPGAREAGWPLLAGLPTAASPGTRGPKLGEPVAWLSTSLARGTQQSLPQAVSLLDTAALPNT